MRITKRVLVVVFGSDSGFQEPTQRQMRWREKQLHSVIRSIDFFYPFSAKIIRLLLQFQYSFFCCMEVQTVFIVIICIFYPIHFVLGNNTGNNSQQFVLYVVDWIMAIFFSSSSWILVILFALLNGMTVRWINGSWSTFFRLTNRYIQSQAKCLWLKSETLLQSISGRASTILCHMLHRRRHKHCTQLHCWYDDMIAESQEIGGAKGKWKRQRNFLTTNTIDKYVFIPSKWTSLNICCV